MEEQCNSVTGSEQSWSMPRSDSMISIGEKRVATCLEGKHDIARKRVKMRDLGSFLASKENKFYHSKSNKKDGYDLLPSSSKGDMSQVTEVPITLDSVVIQAARTGKSTFPVDVKPAIRPLDLNTEDCSSTLCLPRKEIRENSRNLEKVSQHESNRERSGEFVFSRGIGIDLNAVDVSECGSSTGPVQDEDPMKIWKEMKQNGFMSSSHGGIPLPKQRGRKSRSDLQKKRIEIAKKEQVSRFTKLAAPSGLLNELNPGIINHVRNRKQVHSIIEALVRSAKHEHGNYGSNEGHHSTSGKEDISKRKDIEHSYLVLKNDSSSFSCEGKGSDGQQYLVEKSSSKGYTPFSMEANEEDTHTLKLSSSSSLCNEETSNLTGVSSLSVKAATVASRWLELLYQDINGRLSVLQRSKKRLQAVITTELPFLAAKEFPFNQENDPRRMQNSATLLCDATADMHQKRWSKLFEQMDVALSEEEKQLESWLEQVRKMQALSDEGLQHINGYSNYDVQHLELVKNASSDRILNKLDKESTVRAAAASIYSTCRFISSENLTC